MIKKEERIKQQVKLSLYFDFVLHSGDKTWT